MNEDEYSTSRVSVLNQMRLEHEVLMHPATFGRDLNSKIQTRLCEEVEGAVVGKKGIVVSAIKFMNENESERGIIEYETGYASFMVKYDALVFRPFKNEVMDAKVIVVAEHGIWANAGLPNFRIFISKHVSSPAEPFLRPIALLYPLF
jgi:DNA-directed RNA polymerase II subunit RPB7